MPSAQAAPTPEASAPSTRAAAPSTRAAAKAARREQLLAVAKSLFAQHGFHGVRLEDLAKGAGISAPAVYRHFSSKEAVLEELLVGISQYLHDGGTKIVESAGSFPEGSPAEGFSPGEPSPAEYSPAEAIAGLIDFHVDFAMAEPDLIRIQDRDFAALPEAARRSVRRLQRAYVSDWAAVVSALHPDWSVEAATVRVHAAFGMINSTPYLARNLRAEAVRRELGAAARAALDVAADQPPWRSSATL